MSRFITVCVTTHNRASLLDRTVRSLAAQTREPDELIVSDDCSMDETPLVVEKWRRRFRNLRYNRNAQNLYMPGNLNVAVGMANGEYIANLHDADEFDPTLLQKWENVLDRYSSAGFVFCGIAGWPHATPFGNGVILHDVEPLTSGRAFFEKYFLHKWSSIVWGTVMARRACYERLLPFDAAYGFISDVDMWMRMCLYYDVAYVRAPLIVLDNTPTRERRFNWWRVDTMRRIQLANIHRFYADRAQRLRLELARHYFVVQVRYLRGLAGGIKHRDWERVREGFRQCGDIGWPLRALGVFSRA